MSKSNVGQVRVVRGSSYAVLSENAGDALVMRLGNNSEFVIATGFNFQRFDWDSGKYFGQDLEKAMYEWYIEEEVENFENIRKHKVGKEVVNELTGIFFNEDGEEAAEGEDLDIVYTGYSPNPFVGEDVENWEVDLESDKRRWE